MTAQGHVEPTSETPGRRWSADELRALFEHCWVIARDGSAGIVAVAERIGAQGGPLDRPWNDTTKDLHGPDRLAMVRTWWATLDHPGEPQVVEVRAHLPDGWQARRLTMLNLLHQDDWSQVLIGIEDCGQIDPPEPVAVLDRDDVARGRRPVWVLQELDPMGVVLRTDGDVERIFGRPADELEGRVVLEFLHPEDHGVGLDTWSLLLDEPGGLRSVEQRVLRPDGRTCWIESTLINRLDPSGGGSVLSVCHDITERRAVERTLRDRARSDPLTGIPNRHALHERLGEVLGAGAATVAFVDLDGFKSVNDDLGHAAGDDVLIALAHRFAGLEHQGVFAGRWGGDEFVLVAPGSMAPLQLERMVTGALVDPVTVEHGVWFPAASIGVVTAAAGEPPDAAIRRADEAMYDAKPAR